MVTKITPTPPTLNTKLLPVVHKFSRRSEWCWAASAQMVLHYYSRNVSQCSLANSLFGRRICCLPFLSFMCNLPCLISKVDWLYKSFGINSSYNGNPISFPAIQSEINANQPIEVGFSWSKGGGHVAIIRGWEQDNKGEWIRINDPSMKLHQNYGGGLMLYSKLAKPYGLGNWAATWTDLR